MAHLGAAAFEELGRVFAARSADRRLSWAWVDCDQSGPFATRPTGYLRSCPLLLLEHEVPGALDACDTTVECGEVPDEDNSSLANGSVGGRIELHIVHNATYGAPVLLLQGYSADGSLWTANDVRSYLVRRAHTAAPPITADAVSQAEHPALGVPFYSVHPCRTADWMAALLLQGHERVSGSPPGTTAQLDYLSAWWSVLAPLVGDPMSAADACAGILPNRSEDCRRDV